MKNRAFSLPFKKFNICHLHPSVKKIKQIAVTKLFFVCLILFPFSLLAGYNFDDHNTQAYKELLSLRFDKVPSLLEKSLKQDEKNGITLYLYNLYEVALVLVSEDKTIYDKHLNNEDLLLKKLQNLDKSSPYYLFVLSEVRLQNGLARLKMGDDFGALNSLQKAYGLTIENSRKFPGFLPTLRSLGLYQSVLGSVPQNYRWITTLIGFKNRDFDPQLGKKNLETVAQSGTIFAQEAEVLLALIEGYLYTRYEESYEQISAIYKKHPNNALYGLFTAMLGIHAGKSHEIQKVLEKIPDQSPYPSMEFVLYLRCETSLFLGQYEQCVFWGKEFLSRYKGQNYLKDVHYKISLAYLLLSNPVESQTYRNLTLKVGGTRTIQDRSAQKFCSQKVLPSLPLIRARLFFDGGLYDKALQSLENASLKPEETHEYLYRMGRIWHGKKNFDKAIAFYQKTIAFDKEMNTFFGAYSCLQIAYINRDFLSNPQQAKSYFQKVLLYKKYQDKEALEYKAKLALSEMK
jgi:tetratricopeptide (TPR) repeat protein